MRKTGQKMEFLDFLRNFGIIFPLETIKNKKPYCYLYFIVNTLSRKVQVLNLWDKILSANEIVGFF